MVAIGKSIGSNIDDVYNNITKQVQKNLGKDSQVLAHKKARLPPDVKDKADIVAAVKADTLLQAGEFKRVTQKWKDCARTASTALSLSDEQRAKLEVIKAVVEALPESSVMFQRVSSENKKRKAESEPKVEEEQIAFNEPPEAPPFGVPDAPDFGPPVAPDFGPPSAPPLDVVSIHTPAVLPDSSLSAGSLPMDDIADFEEDQSQLSLAPYEYEEFFNGESPDATLSPDRFLVASARRVQSISDGLSASDLMPADFANQMMDGVENLANAIVDVEPNAKKEFQEMQKMIADIHRGSDKREVLIARRAIDELVGRPSDAQVRSEIERILGMNSSLDEKREFLKQIDKSLWSDSQKSKCTELLEPSVGRIKFQNEFAKLLRGIDKNALFNAVKLQAEVQENKTLLLRDIPSDALQREAVKRNAELMRVHSFLKEGMDAILKPPLGSGIDTKKLESSVAAFAEAFMVDCEALRKGGIRRFIDIKSMDIDEDEVKKFLLERGVEPNKLDEIVSVLVDTLRQKYTDNVLRIKADEELNPDSEYCRSSVGSFEGILDKLTEVVGKLPAGDLQNQCKAVADGIKTAFQETVATQGEVKDHGIDALQQIRKKGDYIVVGAGPFAAGAFGSIYKLAHRSEAGAPGAPLKATDIVKVLGTAISPKEWKRYNEEGELVVKKIQHENVLSPSSIILNKKREIIAVIGPYMPGGDLSYIEKDNAPMEVGKAKSILTQIAKGLRALHENNVLHLDLNPGNFLLDENGVVKVMDFGTSKVAGPSGIVIVEPGKRKYSAPEEAEGRVTTKSDCYSFGMMMYKMLEGKPFEGTLNFENVKDPELQKLLSGFLNPDPTTRLAIDAFFQCPYFFQ